MPRRGDDRLLAAARSLAPGREIDDALWVERIVGWLRVLATVVAAAALVIGGASDGPARWILVVIPLLVLPLLARWSRPPVGLALSGDDVLVFSSRRLRRAPSALIDTVAARSIEIDFPGVLSDKWQIGNRRVSVYRGERGRLKRWSTVAEGERVSG